MEMTSILTDRLMLIPMSLPMVNSILNGDNIELEKLGVHTNGQWPFQDTMDILHFIAANMPENDVAGGFGDWMIVTGADKTVIGDAGFKGGPDETGTVEIGFGLISGERRRGYGFEAAHALIKWGLSQSGVQVIKADCLPDNYGSIKVLEKCGMRETGRDKELIHWEIAKPSIMKINKNQF